MNSQQTLRRHYLLIFILLVVGLAVSACGGAASATPTPVPITETPTQVPTQAPSPTSTPVPSTETPTQEPTQTPSPTVTPVPYSSFEESNRFTISSDPNDRLIAAAMSPDGTLIAFTSINISNILNFTFSYTLSIVKSDSGEVLYTYNLDQINPNFLSSIHFLAFSPDNQWLATAVEYDLSSSTSLPKFAIQLWNLADGTLTNTVNVQDLNGLAFSPDGNLLGAPGIGSPATIYLLDARSLDITMLLQSTYYWAFAFDPSSPQFATSSNADDAIHVIDIQSGNEITQIAGNLPKVNVIVYSPDGRLLAFSGYSGADYYSPTVIPGDFSILVWDIQTGAIKTAFPLTGYTGIVKSLAFSPDGTRLVTLGAGRPFINGGLKFPEDQFVRIWDVASGSKIMDINMDDSIESVSFNSDWTRMITAGSNGLIIVWEVR